VSTAEQGHVIMSFEGLNVSRIMEERLIDLLHEASTVPAYF